MMHMLKPDGLGAGLAVAATQANRARVLHAEAMLQTLQTRLRDGGNEADMMRYVAHGY
jgi:hypothetical protein